MRNFLHKSRQVSPLETREALYNLNSNDFGTNRNSAAWQPTPLKSNTIHSRQVGFSRGLTDLIENDTAAHLSFINVIPSFPSNIFVGAPKHGTHQASLLVSLAPVKNSVTAAEPFLVTRHGDKSLDDHSFVPLPLIPSYRPLFLLFQFTKLLDHRL